MKLKINENTSEKNSFFNMRKNYNKKDTLTKDKEIF